MIIDVPPNAQMSTQIVNPIVFVTQVPVLGDQARLGTFGNQKSSVTDAPRGGDLWIRYPNGHLRNLTWETGYGAGADGCQDYRGIAVREPSVSFDAKKVIFSMLVGSPARKDPNDPTGSKDQPCAHEEDFNNPVGWQIYEATNLGEGEAVTITKVPNQPADFTTLDTASDGTQHVTPRMYNNVSPFYASDGRILFTSDRTLTGQTHLYPNLDEYESAQVPSGIWSLNPSTGELNVLNHTPSGAFSPTIDSYGRVIFTRWDHLQRDQQHDAGNKGAIDFSSENPSATSVAAAAEVFPEVRDDPSGLTYSTPYGPANGHRFNIFSPWMMNQDGTDEETLNHIGRHELNYGYSLKTFTSDQSLNDFSNGAPHDNQKPIYGSDGGMFHMREDPSQRGTYVATVSKEFGSLTTNQLIRLTGGPTINPVHMVVTNVTAPIGADPIANSSPGGRYRNPLPLTTGGLIATYTPATDGNADTIFGAGAAGTITVPPSFSGDAIHTTPTGDIRLKLLNRDSSTNLYDGASGSFLTGSAGITTTSMWYNPASVSYTPTFTGKLWELEAVELVARPVPPNTAEAGLENPEALAFQAAGVNVDDFKTWLKSNNLSLIVSRNVATRDRGDQQQPFNLVVDQPGAVPVVSNVPSLTASANPADGRPLYKLKYFQLVQGNQIRAYTHHVAGRRTLPQFQNVTAVSANQHASGDPDGSVQIAVDGSIAAVVPARRAMSWQTTDAQNIPIVRDRVWVTTQPGEIRVCASCHGVNEKDQAGHLGAPQNTPMALTQLLNAWKNDKTVSLKNNSVRVVSTSKKK